MITETAILSKEQRAQMLVEDPIQAIRIINDNSFYEFLKFFWSEVSNQQFQDNWHIPYLCSELEKVAYQVGNRKQKLYDLIINIPPGTTKTITCSIMFPVWCWTKWHWMRFITASYSDTAALESAEYSRDLIRSDLFHSVYPELEIKQDKDTKSNFKVVKVDYANSRPGFQPRKLIGGSRFSTSVGGTVTSFHADIIIWDDLINPKKSMSEVERKTANDFLGQTLSTRKTDKGISAVIGVMQRLHEDDPTAHMLKKKTNIKHISLPGEILNYRDKVHPPELADRYVDNLLDPVRLNWNMLKDLEADLGQYGYAGQIGQDPTPPGGGMFKVDQLHIVDNFPPAVNHISTVRFWDKAATVGSGCYTAGVKMSNWGRYGWYIEDVKRGQWGTEEREDIIKSTARADGEDVMIWVEQEPGSGGKDSAEATVKNLAGFNADADRPRGDKAFRAGPFSTQVNWGNVSMMRAVWNQAYIDELKFFPFSKYKDQVDASTGAFLHLADDKRVKVGL